MAARTAWVLNLDSDLELAVPAYTPKASVRAIVRALVPRVAASLLAPGDVLVDDDVPPGAARGLVGRAFSPTPRALAILERAGAVPEPHPPLGVLRRVTSRAFSASLGATMPDAAFVSDLDAAHAMLARRPAASDTWRIKRAFGMSGRGHRLVTAGAASAADLAFVRAGLGEGGVQIEPNVVVDRELALHGRISPGGAVDLGALVEQRCDAQGAWIETSRATDADAGPIGAALREEASRAAAALHEAGYFGPFGIDAFTWRDGHGALVLRSRSEINARYTMGFAVGFGRRA